MREGWKEIDLKSINESPTSLVIRTCGACMWYQNRLVKSGNNPIYANMCYHIDAKKENSLWMGNLNRNVYGYVEPAEWCPYNEQLERDSKINTILK